MASTGESFITITGAGGSTDSTDCVAHIFSGVDTTTPEDVTAVSTTGSGTTPDSKIITVNSCGCAIITSVGVNLSTVTLTAPSGWLNATTKFSSDTNPSGAGQAWVTNTTTAAADPNAWTSSLSVNWAAATIALRPLGTTFTWQDLSITSADSLMREAGTTVIRSY